MLTRLFPTPAFLSLPAIGIDFSDNTMRFIALKETSNGLIPSQFGEMPIPEGCMKGGRIADEKLFTAFLSEVRKKYRLKYVRVAIPESQTYSFTTTLDILAAKDIRSAIELVLEDNIPLRAAETVFDYHVLSQTESSIRVQVVAIADASVQGFCDAFLGAGLVPVSFELDSQAIARAVVPAGDDKAYMIVDFGANRTGITIAAKGIAVFTSTLEFGGNLLVEKLQKDLNLSLEEARRVKWEYGLSKNAEHKAVFDSLVVGVITLKEEIARRFVYWQEKKEELGEFPSIDTVYLCGGHGNMKGLDDYLSVELKLKVVLANPWVNCLSFERVIPDISSDLAMSYVTTIGLALAEHVHE